jgi:hypothetical protein
VRFLRAMVRALGAEVGARAAKGAR